MEAFIRQRSVLIFLHVLSVAIAWLLLQAGNARAQTGECLQAFPSNPTVSVSDCLAIYRTAVGAQSCEPCVCDANGSGAITTADARTCLGAMADREAPLACPPCGGTATTTASAQTLLVTTTSSSTPIPSTSTTSTTVPPSPYSCTTIFSASTPAPAIVGALQFDVHYPTAPGEFAGTGGKVVCADLTGSLSAFFDNDAQRVLTAGMITLFGFPIPSPVAQCTFNGSEPVLSPDDFSIVVVDATDPELNPIVPTPVVFLSGSNCVSNGPFCGNLVVEPPAEECDDGNTSAGDGCDPYCFIERCGNAIVQIDEQCDDGNQATGDGCRPDCTLEVCGDGILDPSEACDGNAGACPGRCTLNCTCSPECTTNDDCVDADRCTTDLCVDGACRFEPVFCDDHNPCTAEFCDDQSGGCLAKPIDGLPCDDGDTCTTDDTCMGGACTGSAKSCSDGRFCNGLETCNPADGQCVPGIPPLCDDNDACTDDACDEASDACAHVDASPRCDDANLCTDDGCDKTFGCTHTYDPSNDASCVSADGRMTGGGRFYLDADGKDGLTHAFRLMCDAARLPNRMRIVWRNAGQRYRFRLENVRTAACSDNPGIGPEPPEAGFDTHEGAGTGTLQIGRERQRDAAVTWRFTDAGEPNRQDDVSELIVLDGTGKPVLFTAAKLFVGNHQAHSQ